MIIQAAYFDGKTSRRHAVELMHRDGVLVLDGDVRRSFRLADVRVLERAGTRTRKIAFVDGAYLEASDASAFDTLMAEAGYREPMAIKMHHSWRWVLAAIVLLVAVLVPGYLYGLPAASAMIAKRMPERVQHSIGREALGFLDKQFFSPSELPIERQQAIVDRFKKLKLPKPGMPTYEILFRKSKIGPNAFALPSGQIVMTDELVKLLSDDDAVMGVLAHEMGHLHERHLLRRIIQGSAVGLVTIVLFGDASSVVTAIPTAMLDMKYSRDAEREADDYAIAMMQVNGISLDGLKLTFEKLGKKSPQMSAYLSSHPPAAERLARLMEADQKSPLTARHVQKTMPASTASVTNAATQTSPSAASSVPLSAANAGIHPVTLFGEWKPDVEAWVKASHQKGMKPEQEASLRQALSKSVVTFKNANTVHFSFEGKRNGDFAYQAKSESKGCFDLSIAQLGHYWACVNGSVMVMQSQETGETEHFVRR